jgi:low affinity Fe/Cu permease
MVVQIVPVSGRGFAVALFGVFVTGLGSVGPLLVGALSTANFPLFDYADNPYSIRWSLILVNIGTRMILISCVFVLIIFLPYDIKALNTYYDEVAVVEEIEKLDVEEDENETKGLIQS